MSNPELNIYTIHLLFPSGKNLTIDNAEVHIKMQETELFQKICTYLDIVIMLRDFDEINKIGEDIREEIAFKQFFLHIQDCHPNLIRCNFRDSYADTDPFGGQQLKLQFKGNVTDIDYFDYMSNIKDSIKAEINKHREELIKKSMLSSEFSEEPKIIYLPKRKLNF